MNTQAGPRAGLSSRVSVTSHGSGGAFSVKDGVGGTHRQRKASTAGSATFSNSLMNLTQVMRSYYLSSGLILLHIKSLFCLCYVKCSEM